VAGAAADLSVVQGFAHLSLAGQFEHLALAGGREAPPRQVLLAPMLEHRLLGLRPPPAARGSRGGAARAISGLR
jgi:hypothetical protein